jgi:hypothetical protein
MKVKPEVAEAYKGKLDKKQVFGKLPDKDPEGNS